jgi:putative hydrolase of the HAD superfamily
MAQVPPLSRFKVMTFDVVGTCIDFERGMIDYIRKVSGFGPERLTDDTILEAYRRLRKTGVSDHFPEDLTRVYPMMASEFGLPTGAGLAEGFSASIEHWPAFPDTAAALKRLAHRYHLVAMTNAQRWALTRMERTLGHPFHDSVTATEARCEKPDPMFFAYTRGRLSTSGYVLEDILHVAQSQYHDIGVARRLGYTVTWIERRKGMKGPGGTFEAERTEPDYHFASLAELADAVEARAA